MTKDEIMEVVKAWYDVDPSFNTAKALFEHGVTSDEIFDMKSEFGYEGGTRWFMVFSTLRGMERDAKRKVEAENNGKPEDDIVADNDKREGIAPGEGSDDDDSSVIGV
jgi:hypothetical protein